MHIDKLVYLIFFKNSTVTVDITCPFSAIFLCENEQLQHLGSMVTNHGCSDWTAPAMLVTILLLAIKGEK